MRSHSHFSLVCTLVILAIQAPRIGFSEDAWPQWRGPNRDGISTETGLLREWPKDGPKVLWQVDSVGVGYSSLAIKDGRIYTQGDLHGVEHVICLDAKTGKVLWAAQPEPVKARLAERVKKEFERLDVNQDGTIDEVEATQGLGFEYNGFDTPAEGEAEPLAKARVERLFQLLDKNHDQQLSADEVTTRYHNEFERIEKEDKAADAKALATARANTWLAAFDKNGDKMISREESRGEPRKNEKKPEGPPPHIADREDSHRNITEHYFDRIDKKDKATDKGDQLLTFEELETYFETKEAGKDGVITADEMRAFYINKYPHGDGILTAEELRGYYGGLRDGQGNGPRGTPTIDGDYLYTEGGNGDVTCMEVATGKTVWHLNLSTDFGGGRPGWGYSESPLIEGRMLFVTPGGKQGTVVALDKLTGSRIWQSDEVTEGAHYSTPVVANIHGTRTLVQFANKSVFGLTLDTGRFLWQYSGANNGTANCATPIVADNYVFTSSSYGTGGGLAEIQQDGDKQKASEVYFEKKMANHHGGIVKVGDHMYGFGSGLICMDFKTGKIAWQDRSVNKGSLVVADGMLYLLGEGHEVALAEATPEAYREHGRFKITSHGRPSWAHPVVTGGVFYIRDQQSLTAYAVRP